MAAFNFLTQVFIYTALSVFVHLYLVHYICLLHAVYYYSVCMHLDIVYTVFFKKKIWPWASCAIMIICDLIIK